MRRWVPAICVSAMLAVAVFFALEALRYRAFRSAERRGQILRSYGATLEYYHDMDEPVPDSLEVIVATYNASEVGRAAPIDADWPRPEYRPATGLRYGPYLVLVEPLPEKRYRGSRCVLYAYPDGLVDGVDLIEEELLAFTLARDDRRREVGAASQPARATSEAKVMAPPASQQVPIGSHCP